jgi:DNA (cytosine-5)-methyltransferase 1
VYRLQGSFRHRGNNSTGTSKKGGGVTSAYYNEIDPYAAQWLRNLIAGGHIAAGDVDERSIIDVKPDDLRGYTQAHFFAGIGGWSLALKLAGWPDDRPVWTGSCPCQSFSSASNSRNLRRSDERHLWPYWKLLIQDASPSIIFGEQVAQAADWLDEVCDDLEELDYSVAASILPACSVGFDHARPRIYFVGYANSDSKSSQPFHATEAQGLPWNSGNSDPLVYSHGVSNRMAELRAFGNAIVPQVAAEFIRASQ